MTPNVKILFVGGGNMSQAIIAGFIKKHFPPLNIFVADRNEDKLAALKSNYGVNTSLSLEEFTPLANIIFLSVKPQGAKIACEHIKSLVADPTLLFISVMAGITIEKLHGWLGQDALIVRTMPNTPALIQKGATGMFASPNVSEAHRRDAESFLSAIGITAWVPRETDLNIITALSGSGPAYYFYFIELMRKTAIEMGLSPIIADSFAIQTAYGAAALADAHEKDVIELRQQVTSKKGTTEAAIKVMESSNIGSVFTQAMRACAERCIRAK